MKVLTEAEFIHIQSVGNLPCQHIPTEDIMFPVFNVEFKSHEDNTVCYVNKQTTKKLHANI